MSKTQKYSADIMIVGGGAAGLACAVLLGQKGLNVHVTEPYPPKSLKETDPSGRTVALMQGSLNILRAAGLSEFIDEYGTEMRQMRIIDDSFQDQEPLVSDFDSFDIGLEYFGKNIPNSSLRAALYERAQALESVTIHQSALHDLNARTARLEDGTEITGTLIVGADGRESVVRQFAAIGVNKKTYDQAAVTCIINHSRAHDFTSTEFHRSGGPFALVPMRGNQSSVVWVEKTAKADALMAMPKDAFERALQAATNDILGGVTLASNPKSWPLCAITAKSLIAPHIALIAEAAHVMSPITAQGLNLSLRDVATLCEVIVDALRLGQDFGSVSVLETYASRRRLDIATRTMGVNGMNQIVRNDIAPIKDTRRLGLRVLNRVPALKAFAMKHGLAPTLDQGRLAMGEAL